ncbi:cell division protein [Vulcanimicrobium alpinum]|uniref:Cell division protein n=1 Tax=Vulcanimicrobium alpinum TaxID=3016050 RepID=A0AAN1XWU2_UNVUL|nr:YggT family protein [Vulcanimicrobium alpinum]BDE06430.1 cell division protein [Vulcanimicrobium alpinum]
MCQVWQVVDLIFKIYVLLMIVYAVVSWVPSIRGRWSEYLAMLIEPVLAPVRRIVPPLGGLDLSFIIVIIVIQLVDSQIVRNNLYACVGGY